MYCTGCVDAELQKKVVSAEKKNARLVEAFKKTSQDYREVVYQTLGYKLGKHYFHPLFFLINTCYSCACVADVVTDANYKLMSMYAETSDDYFRFQVHPL